MPLNLTEIPYPLIDYFVASASDVLQNSNDAEKTTSEETYTKLKEIKLNADLAGCRLKFELKVMIGTAYGKVYKNGSPVGTEQSTGSATYVTFSEDFAGWVKGDLIQIYCKNGSPGVTSIANMRLYYDLTSVKIAPTNQDP